MKAIFKLFVFVLLIVSCSTIKKATKESYTAQSNTTNTIKEQRSKTVVQKDTSIANEQIDIRDTTTATVTIVDFSPPDANGKQHIMKRTTEIVKKWSRSENNKRIAASKNTTVKEQQSRADSTKSNSNTSQQVSQTIKKTGTPISIYIILTAVAVILTIGIVIKKYLNCKL